MEIGLGSVREHRTKRKYRDLPIFNHLDHNVGYLEQDHSEKCYGYGCYECQGDVVPTIVHTCVL